VCKQDLSNAQGVDALVAGSLRVQQLYGDEDEKQGTGDGVGTNNNLTRGGKQGVMTKMT